VAAWRFVTSPPAQVIESGKMYWVVDVGDGAVADQLKVSLTPGRIAPASVEFVQVIVPAVTLPVQWGGELTICTLEKDEALRTIWDMPFMMLAKTESFTVRVNVVDAPGLQDTGVSEYHPKLSAAVVDSKGMFWP
jgi:hypothetical protein